MGLNVPELDDQRYEDLREAALKRLPTQAPEWTDHNVHDPGITIIELLAWLVESYSYQLDQVTDEHRGAYLRLLGTAPKPPSVATVQLAVEPGEDPTSRVLPPGTAVEAETPDRTVRTFETDHELVLTNATIAALVTEHADGRADRTDANDRPDRAFAPFGRDATVGNALYVGFGRDPFGEHTQLDLVVDHANPMGVGADTAAFEPSIAVQWQYLTNPDAWFDDDGWTDLEARRDETRAWYRGGRISLPQPLFWEGDEEAAAILGVDEPLVWLRAVLQDTSSGADPDRARYERPPKLHALRTNVLTASHTSHVDDVSLERIDRPGQERPPQPPHETTGRANQQFAFPRAPVLDAHIRIGEHTWHQVPTFATSGGNDRHYRLDHDGGLATFGDGRRGAIPPPGEPVEATEVVYGGGSEGNVPENARWSLGGEGGPVTVRSLAPPRGGRASESIAEALERVRGDLSTPHRAVTGEDYVDLALRTPGVEIARAAVVENEDHHQTTVVIIPDGPADRHPTPTRGMRSAVETHLQERTLLTDRVTVVGPTYVSIGVTATVRTAENATDRAVEAAVRDALAEFIDPLSGYDGDGWPFDRPMHRSDLFEVIDAVEAVNDAIDITIDAGAAATLRDDPTSVPYLANVSVSVDPDAAPCWRDRP